MRKFGLLFLPLLVVAMPAYGQDCCSRVTISGSYSYFSASPKSDQIPSATLNSRIGQHGFGVQFAYNHTSWWGGVIEVSRHTADTKVKEVNTDTRTLTVLVGPQFYGHGDGIDIFGHALVGVARRQAESLNKAALDLRVSSTDFALGIGGGIDIPATQHFAIRVLQVDYIPTRGRDNSPNIGKRWSQNFRAEVGFVLRFGYAN